jgi:hypothetical protein
VARATAYNTRNSAVVELQQRYDGSIPACARAQAIAEDAAEDQRVRALSPRQQAAELVTSQRDQLSGESRYILAILAKRRSARIELRQESRDYPAIIRAKAAMDAAERDARYALRWYFAERKLLAKFNAELAAAMAAERSIAA